MAWAIFAFGFVVIGLAVAVALGRGGQMQAEPVLDTPRGRIPEGPVDDDFLDGLVVPRRLNGYDTGQVDRFLASWVSGPPAGVDGVRFDVRLRGYDMGVVDRLLARMGEQAAQAVAVPDPGSPEPDHADAPGEEQSPSGADSGPPNG